MQEPMALAKQADETKARMPDRIRHRTLGSLGGVLAMDVDAHAHLGDTAHACHFDSSPVSRRETERAPSSSRRLHALQAQRGPVLGDGDLADRIEAVAWRKRVDHIAAEIGGQ